MENYTEFLVKKNWTAKDKAIAVAITLALILVVVLVSLWLGIPSGFVVLAFGGYGAFYLITGLGREYEYVLTNDQLDVDEIIAQRRRRRLCEFTIENMEVCAGINNPDKKGEMSRQFTKTINAASSPDAEGAYFAIFDGDSGVNLLIFEPNEKILNAMSLYAKSKVFK